MNKLFKDIRHSDIEAVRAAISKNGSVVNEFYNAKAPKKDIGQSPLQVAIKCGEFEIIELLLEKGADADFMEDPALVPPHSVCMSVLHDAKYGADKEEGFNQDFWGVSNKVYFFEEKMYGMDNTDIREPIRIVLKEYFD